MNNSFAKVVGLIVLIGIVLSSFYLIPRYNVWAKSMKGKATLAQAEYEKQARVYDAQAEAESMTLEVEAMREQADFYNENPEFVNRLFMRDLGEAFRNGTISSVVYIPHNNLIPNLEDGRAVQYETAAHRREAGVTLKEIAKDAIGGRVALE